MKYLESNVRVIDSCLQTWRGRYRGGMSLLLYFTSLLQDPPPLSDFQRISRANINGNPLQYYCLENPMDRGALQATVHGVAKSWTRLSDFTFTFIILPGLSRWFSGKEPACQCRRLKDAGLIPGLGRSPGGGHGNSLQSSCLENPRGSRPHLWGRTESDTTEATQQQQQQQSYTLQPHGLQPTRLLCLWNSPSKNTGVGIIPFSRGSSQPRSGIPTQGSNPGLLYCRQILYHLSHQGSPQTPKFKLKPKPIY